MMTMSKALGAAQAKSYYGSEYTNSRESYYAEGGGVEGEWAGQLAEELGLQGAVDRERFERLIDGQDPFTGEQLVRHVATKEYTNEFGEGVKTSGHRAGWDATFSAPKSVSIAALVGRDQRVREAHREAVEVSLRALEKYTQARLGGNTPSPMTGKFIAAKFEHDSARPDKETGYAAPQLHTHAIIFNLTRTAEERAKPVQERELFRSQQYATAIYRAHLAERLLTLGYEIEIDRRTGAPEIKGFSPEYIRANSPRREEVKREAEGMKARLAAAGITVKEGAGLNQAAAKTDRRSKRYDRAEMQRRHQELDAQYGHQAQHVTAQAMERGGLQRSPEEVRRRAQEAVTFARDHAMEREAVADLRKVTADALRRNMGLTTYEAVKDQLAARERRGEFVPVVREHEPKRTTTGEMLNLERSNIRGVLADQGQAEPITGESRAAQLLEAAAAGQRVRLNESQRAAIETILVSRDRIIGLQGGAGTGKTTTLATLKAAAERSGYEVKGFAPTTKAVRELGKSGIESVTIQKFLRSRQYAPDGSDNEQKRLYVLDESSLASSRNLAKFFARVGAQDKILLVGDVRQHQAVEAGSPFEQLQKHGMRTARLTEIVRQKDERLKEVVERLSAKDVRRAVNELRAQGRVVEIPNDPQSDTPDRARLEAIATDYAARPEGTLVISPANKERVAINCMIHRQLQVKGLVAGTDHRATVLTNRQEMTGAERTFAASYMAGEDIVRYNTGSKVYGVRAGEYGRVVANNYHENSITVRLEGGREITYNPKRLQGVSVYKEAERQFAEGDRVQFRAPLPDERVANGELGRIERIEGGRYAIRLEGGRGVSVDTNEFKHFDHGYAVTSYLAQGETVDRVIINANTNESDAVLNRRMSYVAVSRARFDARVYTDSAAKLGEALDRQVDKQMALEAIAECGMRNADSNPQSAFHNPQLKERRWINVSHREPCQVCQKPDGCTRTEDGALAWCRRVESERQRGPGWLHILADREGFVPREISNRPQVTKYERATIEHRDDVYRELLRRLELVERDREDLAGRGLSAERMKADGYASVPATRKQADEVARDMARAGLDLRGVPGFWRDESAGGPPAEQWRLNLNYWYRGYLIPVKNHEGRIESFQDRRAEVKTSINPTTGKEEKEPKYVWLSSDNTEDHPRPEGTSPGSPIHYVGVGEIRRSGHAIITEGALKGNLINHYLDRGVVTVQGVGNFPDDFGARLRERLPELRKVSIAFDADYAHNPAVALQLKRLHGSLTAAKLEVETLRWDERQGKGLDDYARAKLTPYFHYVRGPERARYQDELLREIGWHEPAKVEASREQTVATQARKQLDPAEDRDAGAKRAYDAELKEIERRILLGDELADRWDVQHRMERVAAAREGGRVRRYEVTDQGTGLKREISIHDVEGRVDATSRRVADEHAPATGAEREMIRRAAFDDEMGRHRETITAIESAHDREVKRCEGKLNEAVARHNESASRAHEVRGEYTAEGRDVPVPIITPERLDELHEQAVERRDAEQIKRLEEIRRALPEEFGDVTRDEHTAGRLEGHLLIGRAGLQAAEKRAEDFERASHFRRWEVGGELWSRFQIDRRLARAEAKAAFQEGQAATYTEKTKFKLRNLPDLLDRGENRRQAEAAQAEAEGTRIDVERLQAIREEVGRLIEAEREGLRVGVEREKVFVGVLSDVVEGERERRASVGLGVAAPVLTEGEMRRLDAHAAVLHDPELLRQHDELGKQMIANLPSEAERERLSQGAARAFGREQAAGIALNESIERLAAFEERRLDMPLLYTDASGEQRVATLREVEPHSTGDRVMSYFTETDGERERRAAVRQAALDRHQQLLNDREGAGAFYLAAREIAEQHIERLHKIDPPRELPAPHYTAKEVAQIETFAAKQKDEESRTIYEEMMRAAVVDGRVGYAKSNQPKQTQQEPTHSQAQIAESPPEQGRSAVEHDQGSTLKVTFNKALQTNKAPDQSRNTNTRGYGSGVSW